MTRTRFREGRLERPSVVLAVAVEAAAARLGARLTDPRHEVEPFEEAQLGAFCSRCCAWGHTTPQCLAATPRWALCMEDHQTADHRRSVEGCRARWSHTSAHLVAKCRNCSGSQPSQASVCPVKKEARRVAKGWRPPSPPRREWATAPPEKGTPESPGPGRARRRSRCSRGPRSKRGGGGVGPRRGEDLFPFSCVLGSRFGHSSLSFFWRIWGKGDQGALG